MFLSQEDNRLYTGCANNLEKKRVLASLEHNSDRVRSTSSRGLMGFPIWVTGDPGRLQQAISNLLSNVIKFTPAGGTVKVCLDTVDQQARLRVIDSGEGMSSGFLPFAFEDSANRTAPALAPIMGWVWVFMPRAA